MKKTSRTFKRFAAITSASLLAACMVAPMSSFAVDPGETTYTITITFDSDSDLEHGALAAYQIFDGTWNTGDNNLTVAKWGSGIDAEKFIKALKADETIGDDFAGVEEEENEITAQAVAGIVAGYTSGSPEAEAFAKLAVQNKTTSTGTYDSDDGTITGVDAGYYVIADSSAASAGQGYSSYTLGLLYVANDTRMEVSPKIDYPTVVKKVQEDDKVDTDTDYGPGYNDVADWDVNTPVPFKIIATLPSNIDDYSHYYLKFTDTLDDNFGNPDSIVVKIGDTTLTKDTHYTITPNGNDMTIEILDVKGCDVNVSAGTEVTVTYTAKLNVTDTVAEIGLNGQENKVTMTYSNNPNKAGDGTAAPEDTDTTPEDKVIVFTYEIDITKINGETEETIEGAEFKLANSAGKYAKVDSNGYFTEWVDSADDATVLTSDENGIFKIIGLDKGTYSLYEMEWSDEYNIPTTPFVIEIDATTSFTQDSYDEASDALTGFTGSVGGEDDESANATDGIVSGIIINNKGTVLPGTGGIGTTVFYLGGGAMVAVAGVYLISKKRMKNAQE